MSEIPPPTVPPATPPPPGGGSYTPPPPAGGTTGGSDRSLMLVLSYLWILSLIPLLTKKEDSEVQWHAKNGLVLFGAEIAVWIVITVLQFALPSGFGLGCGMSTLSCVVWIGFLVLHILCIVKAVGGQRFRIPVLTDFAEKM